MRENKCKIFYMGRISIRAKELGSNLIENITVASKTKYVPGV